MFQQAMNLDEAELRELWERLGDELTPTETGPGQVHEPWMTEIHERSRRVADGTETTIPWEEVRERMCKRVRGG